MKHHEHQPARTTFTREPGSTRSREPQVTKKPPTPPTPNPNPNYRPPMGGKK